MGLRLHTAKVADWDKKGSGPHNLWQKIASRSYGTLTPANVASLAGAVVAIYGLLLLADGEVIKGLILVAIGRLADLADGLIAEYTKTKSPLGEIIDASMDKLVMAFALIVFVSTELVPWPIVLVVALQNVANVVISVLARLRKKILHPSRNGKLSTAYSWVVIILYPLGSWLYDEDYKAAGIAVLMASLISFVVYLLTGIRASINYAQSISGEAK